MFHVVYKAYRKLNSIVSFVVIINVFTVGLFLVIAFLRQSIYFTMICVRGSQTNELAVAFTERVIYTWIGYARAFVLCIVPEQRWLFVLQGLRWA